MLNEIGSEFEFQDFESGKGIKLPRIGSLVFSGRTAIEYVLTHIEKYHKIQSALVPSYCCDSMLEPFQRKGIKTLFYTVNFRNGLEVELREDADLLLWCNYFGFQLDMPSFDGLIIEDITHSFLSEKNHHAESDYLVASLRKWEPVTCGGYCSIPDICLQPPEKSFTENKLNCMKWKLSYLQNQGIHSKSEFLNAFRECNFWLSTNYSEKGIDDFSKAYLEHADIEYQRKRRIRNGKILYSLLSDRYQFLFPLELMDCPLFVPILLENRNVVRQKLIDNGIFCPVHWPHPKADCDSNLYDLELSLVCDQRYGDEDMERLADVLNRI